MKKQNQSTKRSGFHRPGFTVVELLVVIAIIGVLAALITGAVFAAIGSARNATIKMEVNQLAMALERYKTEMGEYPPDLSQLSVEEKRAAIDAHLARKYRLRNSNKLYEFENNNPREPAIGGDQLTDAEIQLLNPTNALPFWLRGFSTDPQRPLTGTGERDPYYEFAGRVIPPGDIDTSGLDINEIDVSKPAIVTFAPKADSQQRPYIYYRATPAFPTVPGSNTLKKIPYYDAAMWVAEIEKNPSSVLNVPNVSIPLPYLSAILQHSASVTQDDMTAAIDAAGSTRAKSWCEYARPGVEPEKYQIICAGMDGEYGDGGLGTADVGVYPTGTFRKSDRDNITNFGEGSTLEDAQ